MVGSFSIRDEWHLSGGVCVGVIARSWIGRDIEGEIARQSIDRTTEAKSFQDYSRLEMDMLTNEIARGIE